MRKGGPILRSSKPARHAATPAPIPERIGTRYQVVQELGRGGMAVVYRAIDIHRGEQLALKQALLHGQPARDRELVALFESEFHRLSQLKHPSVIAVYDYGLEPSGPYYTMELLDGGDLSTRAPLPYREACELMMQVSSSLSLLHSRGLLHRDISPRNVRCTSDGRAKLIDFGAMSAMGPCEHIVGTPSFIAPEVAHRSTLDGRTDLFALGATLYHALTGRLAYPARTMAELREAWRQDPLPPSELGAEVPVALDELVMAMIGIDPARRPRSAFEVMQRLAAIAGVAVVESSDISASYLSTPTLVGRERELTQFREHMFRAMQGQGGGVLLESAPGAGRSRMLDACVLEAKTLGATVLRLRGGAAEGVAFAGAHALAQQLCEALPEGAVRAARDSAALTELFDERTGANDGVPAVHLRPLSEWRGARYALQAALSSWIRRVSLDHPLLIAIDDAERVDEATLALIAALAHAAKGHAIAIAVTLATSESATGPLSLHVLTGQCTRLPLAPLTHEETVELFSSVFGDAPHVALLSDRIYQVAAGSPRESMALAQHLLDRRRIRYHDGNWRLPSTLAMGDLPASADEAFRSQLARLSPLALRLARAQAISMEGPWTRADYAEIAGEEARNHLDEALAALVRAGVLVASENAFSLKYHAVRSELASQLTAEEARELHARLADLAVHSGRPSLLEVYHAHLAGDAPRALERMAEVLRSLADGTTIYDHTQVPPQLVLTTLEGVLERSIEAGRSPRELNELRRHLTMMSVPTETRLFYHYGSRWLEQLQRDSGLTDYLATDPSLEPGARLQAALGATMARYAATPEHERVYPFDHAIKLLALYVTNGIVIGSRWCDTRLLASLPGQLEPFTALTPVLHALWQNVVAGGEMNYLAQPERARDRVLEVYNRLSQVSVRDLPNVAAIRYAISYALGVLEASLGYTTAELWIEVMKEHPLQQVNAMYMRRLLCLYSGDLDGAESYRKQAEVLAVQASSRQMFDVQHQLELAAQVHAGNLAGVKQAVDRIEALATEVPFWRPQQHLAQGHYQRMRGDLAAAKAAFERALELSDPAAIDPPANLNVWVNAAGGYTNTLLELGLAEEARAFALQSLKICEDRAIGGWSSHITRGLALAEAKLGDFESAKRRLDDFIASRADLHPSRLGVDYEARARIAIWEKDAGTARYYAELAAGEAGRGQEAMLAKHSRLLEEAKQVGLDLGLPSTAFETSILGGARPRSAPLHLVKVTAALAPLADARARAQRALELLCETTSAAVGHLFLVEATALVPVASIGGEPDPELLHAVSVWWQEQVTQLDLTTLVTEDLRRSGAPRSVWQSDAGRAYRFVPLKGAAGPRVAHAGIAVLAIPDASTLTTEYWPLGAAIVSRLVAHGDVDPVYLD